MADESAAVARSGSDVEARFQELQSLHQISQIILESIDAETVMQRILQEASRIGGFDIGLICFVADSRQTLEPVAHVGFHDHENVNAYRRHMSEQPTAGVDLVSDFLDVSKLEAGFVDIHKEATDLGALLQKSLENYLILAQDKQVSLKRAIDPSLPLVQADSRRLEQVFGNLISNAIKFSREGGEIEVGAALSHAREAKVWVKDHGAGIPQEEIGMLFEKYRRKYRQCSNINESGRKGTGLGLVICKMIVQGHGGEIWVESEYGKGSAFYFSLPLGLEN